MAIIISGNGIDMGGNPVSNASQVEVQKEQVSPFGGFKNYIINGNFDIWQRGTSGFFGQNYGADRWLASTGVESYSRQNANSLGGYYARITRTTASTGTLLLTQRIEQINVKDLRRKILTLSFYTRQTSGTTIPINVHIYTPTIADNYASVTLQQTISALSNPTSTFQKVSVSFTVNDEMALKGFSITIGNLTAGTSSIDIAQVQLEEGSVATPFEQRPYGLELSLCQRYYELSPILASICIPASSSYLGGTVTWGFKQTKRTVPTITIATDIGTKTAVVKELTTDGCRFGPATQSTLVHDHISLTAIASAEL